MADMAAGEVRAVGDEGGVQELGGGLSCLPGLLGAP